MKKFIKETWAIIGYVFGLIGTVVTIFSVPGTFTLDIKWLIIAGFTLMGAIVFGLLSILRLKKMFQTGTRFEITAYGCNRGNDVYYTYFSHNLRIGTLVTFYYTKPFSKRLGYGVVCNASTDEYIEMSVIYIEEEFTDIFIQSKTNNRKVLQDMYILPNTYIEELDRIREMLSGGNDSHGKN